MENEEFSSKILTTNNDIFILEWEYKCTHPIIKRCFLVGIGESFVRIFRASNWKCKAEMKMSRVYSKWAGERLYEDRLTEREEGRQKSNEFKEVACKIFGELIKIYCYCRVRGQKNDNAFERTTHTHRLSIFSSSVWRTYFFPIASLLDIFIRFYYCHL